VVCDASSLLRGPLLILVRNAGRGDQSVGHSRFRPKVRRASSGRRISLSVGDNAWRVPTQNHCPLLLRFGARICPLCCGLLPYLQHLLLRHGPPYGNEALVGSHLAVHQGQVASSTSPRPLRLNCSGGRSDQALCRTRFFPEPSQMFGCGLLQQHLVDALRRIASLGGRPELDQVVTPKAAYEGLRLGRGGPAFRKAL